MLGGSESADLISKTDSSHLRSRQKSCGWHNRGVGSRHRSWLVVFVANLKRLIINFAAQKCCTRVVAVWLIDRMCAVWRLVEALPTYPGIAHIQRIAFGVSDDTACCIIVNYLCLIACQQCSRQSRKARDIAPSGVHWWFQVSQALHPQDRCRRVEADLPEKNDKSEVTKYWWHRWIRNGRRCMCY